MVLAALRWIDLTELITHGPDDTTWAVTLTLSSWFVKHYQQLKHVYIKCHSNISGDTHFKCIRLVNVVNFILTLSVLFF